VAVAVAAGAAVAACAGVGIGSCSLKGAEVVAVVVAERETVGKPQGERRGKKRR
jgi:hypothetical protein